MNKDLTDRQKMAEALICELEGSYGPLPQGLIDSIRLEALEGLPMLRPGTADTPEA